MDNVRPTRLIIFSIKFYWDNSNVPFELFLFSPQGFFEYLPHLSVNNLPGNSSRNILVVSLPPDDRK